jgi:hypothetical protein
MRSSLNVLGDALLDDEPNTVLDSIKIVLRPTGQDLFCIIS